MKVARWLSPPVSMPVRIGSRTSMASTKAMKAAEITNAAHPRWLSVLRGMQPWLRGHLLLCQRVKISPKSTRLNSSTT